MSRRTLDAAAEQAIDWMIVLRGDNPGPAQQQRFERWLAADPAHTNAWNHLQQQVSAPYERLRALDRRSPGHARQAREVLQEPLASRRNVLRGLGALGLLGGASWLGVHSGPGQVWLADVSTGTGRRQSLNLPDGSHLTLNACSAANLDFTATRRCVSLCRGELIVETRGSAHAQPLGVRTEQALVSGPEHSRWLVSQQPQATLVVALGNGVQVQHGSGSTLTTLARHEAVRIDHLGVRSLGLNQQYRADWLQGLFSAVDEPLLTLVQALRPYRSGLIRVSAAASTLRVQGVFSLDRPDQALDAMAQSLPIRIEHYSPWLVLIDQA